MGGCEDQAFHQVLEVVSKLMVSQGAVIHAPHTVLQHLHDLITPHSVGFLSNELPLFADLVAVPSPGFQEHGLLQGFIVQGS